MSRVRLRRLLAPLLLLAAATAHAQPDETTAAAEPVLRQLEAFRRNDYDTAYALASAQIHGLFDRAAFERMVKAGYPEIADSSRAHVAKAERASDGHVYLLMKIRGGNGRHIAAVYDMVFEGGAWRINGVVATPDPGEEA